MTKYTLFIVALSAAAVLSCSVFQKHTDPAVLRTPAEFKDDVKALDPKKKTVCTVTLNSSEEGDTFREYLPDFNSIELVTDSIDWLEESCNSGVRCDVVVVSGHFGGGFFGDHGRLDMEPLESISCRKSCPGIFNAPKEVFLFGCNTLSGKDKDFRSPEEYRDVLIRDGFSFHDAEIISAYRYSPLGNTYHDRMRQIFPEKHTNLYGFRSIAPAGRNVKHMLQNYFNENAAKYSEHLDKLESYKTNSSLAKALKVTTYTQGGPSQGSEPASCILNAKDKSVNEKLAWIDSKFKTPGQVLPFVPAVENYLEELEQKFNKRMPEAEASYFERLQFNKAARAEALGFIEHRIPGLLNAQAKVLRFAQRVAWLYGKEVDEKINFLVSDLFKNNISHADANSFCSSQIRIDLTLESLPQQKWSADTIRAIGCSGTANAGVQNRMLELANTDADLHEVLLSALAYMEQTPATLDFIFNLTHSENENIRKKAVSAALRSRDPRVRGLVLELLSAGQVEDLRYFKWSKLMGAKDPDLHAAMVKLAHNPDAAKAKVAIYYFRDNHNASEEEQLAIVQAFKESGKNFEALVQMLDANAMPSVKIQWALFDALAGKENNYYGLYDLYNYLQKVKLAGTATAIRFMKFAMIAEQHFWSLERVIRTVDMRAPSIRKFMLDGIRSADFKSREPYYRFNNIIRWNDKAFEVEVAKGLSSTDSTERNLAVWAFLMCDDVSPANTEKIKSLLLDADGIVRSKAIQYLAGIKWRDPRLRAVVFKELMDTEEGFATEQAAIAAPLFTWSDTELFSMIDVMDMWQADYGSLDYTPILGHLEMFHKFSGLSPAVQLRLVPYLKMDANYGKAKTKDILIKYRPFKPEVASAIRALGPGIAGEMGL